MPNLTKEARKDVYRFPNANIYAYKRESLRALWRVDLLYLLFVCFLGVMFIIEEIYIKEAYIFLACFELCLIILSLGSYHLRTIIMLREFSRGCRVTETVSIADIKLDKTRDNLAGISCVDRYFASGLGLQRYTIVCESSYGKRLRLKTVLSFRQEDLLLNHFIYPNRKLDITFLQKSKVIVEFQPSDQAGKDALKGRDINCLIQ